MTRIPLARPLLGSQEVEAAARVIRSGWITQGPEVAAFETAFASYAGAAHACAVSSCTTALQLGLLVAGVSPGDVVVTVSHSFIATANSIRHCGAEPAFVDIEPDTFNMAPEALERFLGEACGVRDGGLFVRTWATDLNDESPLKWARSGVAGRVAAILPVHQMGMPCEIDRIVAIARAYGLPVVEDAACAAGSQWSPDGGTTWEMIGRPHGDVACFSFHPRKVLTTGDGGMLTTNRADFDARFRLLRHHGMNLSDAARHHATSLVIEQYVTTGYNFRMTDIQAAIGSVQLGRLTEMVAARRRIDQWYREMLGDIGWLRLPIEPARVRSNFQSYPATVAVDAPCSRDDLLRRLLDAGIASKPGIMNAHQEAPYRAGGFRLPVSEAARDRVLLLPLFVGMTRDDVAAIREVIQQA